MAEDEAGDVAHGGAPGFAITPRLFHVPFDT